MALLATQTISYAGIAETLVAAAGGGDEFTPEEGQFIKVVNGGGGSINVTIVTPGTFKGQAIADIVVAVPNGAHRLIRVTPPELFANPADGKGDITYSGVTSVTVGVFALDRTL